ncbi:MAG: pilus assembly protein TadG-related protein [Candidatus Binataceae bacterium]
MNTGARFSKGQMLALFTIILPVLLGVIALGADFSVIYFNWSMVQKAADAAALAGASQLTAVPGSAPSVTPNADNYVNGYACLNGIHNGTSTLCTAGTSPNGYADKIVFTHVTDTTVQVGIQRSVPYFFGKMIGLQEASVAATATASVTGLGTIPSGLFPVGFQCTAPCSLNDLGGSPVTFGQKFVGSVGASGNWQWLDVGQGNGASALGSVLQSGSTESFSVGQTIGSSPGNKGNSNPAKTGLANRLATCSAANKSTPLTSLTDPCQNGALNDGTDGIGGTATGAVPINDPCLVTVPAVDFTGCNGSCSLTIEGFAQVYLEQDSTSTSIDACYVKGSTTTNVAGSPTAPDLGPITPPLLTN